MVAAFGGADQPGAVEAVEGRDVGSVSQGQLEQFEVSLAGRDEVSALLGGVLCVDVCTGRDQCCAIGRRRCPMLRRSAVRRVPLA